MAAEAIAALFIDWLVEGSLTADLGVLAVGGDDVIIIRSQTGDGDAGFAEIQVSDAPAQRYVKGACALE